MWRTLSLVCLSFVLCIGGCNGGISRSLDRVDATVARARAEMKEGIREAKTEVDDSLKKAQVAASELREDVSGDVKAVQERLDRQLTALDEKVDRRIEQVRTSAAELIRQGDAAVQARIDQVFTELRLFVKDTLQEIRALILPILDLATKLGSSVQTVNESIVKVTTSVTGLIDRVTESTSKLEARVDSLILSFQGKDENGKPIGFDYAAIFGAIFALVKSFYTDKKRADEKKAEGERWKLEEIQDEVMLLISSGKLDEVIRARLAVLKSSTEPNKPA
jgi:uncharacterized protein YoxC